MGIQKTICSYLLELYSVNALESEVINKMNKRIVQDFLDMVILLELEKRPLSGYDVISFIHKKFHMLLSSGTVYAYLYALERDGLVEGQDERRKRVYTLTERGKETVVALLNSKDKILGLVLNLFVGE
jgi:DNA-binding PadR family transcriptional regulator